MSEQGKEEAKRQALVRAKANGFAQGGHENPAFRTTTERFDQVMEPDLDMILRKTKRAWIRGLDSPNTKIAVDTAHKLTGHLYRPAAEVKVEHSGEVASTVQIDMRVVDGLSATDRALLSRAQKALGQEQQEIEEAEVVVEIEEDETA